METGMKRKHNESDDETSDDTWVPESSQEPEAPAEPPRLIHTRSRGAVERPTDTTPIDTVMDAADKVVDNESDLSSDTEEDDEEDDDSFDSCEEEEDESEEEDDYSDDDSFVTSNEDPDREERDEIITSYSRVFGDDEEEEEEDIPQYPDEVAPQLEEDLSIGGYLVGSGDM